MKLNSALTINGKKHPAGSYISPMQVYPFFLIHMAMFGGSGFFLAYGGDSNESRESFQFLLMHGGFAILVYVIFFFAIFGRERVKWMFIDAGLGLYGIVAQIGWILHLFGREISDYPWYIHVVPSLYYVMYTFLLHQAVLDFTGARENESQREKVERYYVGTSLLTYTAIAFF